jgi:hypothetical protein
MHESLLSLIEAIGKIADVNAMRAPELTLSSGDRRFHLKFTMYVPIHVTIGQEVTSFLYKNRDEAIRLFLDETK